MENVKVFAAKQINHLTTDPIGFSMNVLVGAVGIWFASVILNIAIRVAMDSYTVITSAF
jgi:hypothetical protein